MFISFSGLGSHVFDVAVDPVSGSAHRLDECRSRLEPGQVRFDVRVIVDDATAFDNRRPHDAVSDNDVDSCQPAPQQTNYQALRFSICAR